MESGKVPGGAIGWIHVARDAQSHDSRAGALTQNFVHAFDHEPEDRIKVVLRYRPACSCENVTGRVHDHGSYMAAAQINAYRVILNERNCYAVLQVRSTDSQLFVVVGSKQG